MKECKFLITKDITPWHSDVFDHPVYTFFCKLSGKEILPYGCRGNSKCKKYEPVNEDEKECKKGN